MDMANRLEDEIKMSVLEAMISKRQGTYSKMAVKKKPDAGFRNKVYLTDSRDMREFPDGSIGLIVTSPPYFNIKDYSKDGKQENSHSASHAKQIGDIADF